MDLPPAVAERLKAEISQAFRGDAYMGAATHRSLMQALRPHEAALARALCRNSETLPDGTIRLLVPRNIGFLDTHLDPTKWEIPVEYRPKSGEWCSEVAAGGGGFDRLCAHVWRIQGRSDGMAARQLLALIGAAYLSALAHRDAL
ncbi:hypothetical protein MGN01_43720 [Methylobacterium gnaphalii]|uniref:Uncharacterized protein n=1 Tax=Methylobacterium gnaphalii TaxID=1010610 RepID=A0A512JRE2_9HYPH|nr:hypothetical protein MGN01_43720 [Methylobacterium gnaphalii]GLS51511.1 hypothetical protein GCM10007885_43690 [Methylobacterium gnaphalii]